MITPISKIYYSVNEQKSHIVNIYDTDRKEKMCINKDPRQNVEDKIDHNVARHKCIECHIKTTIDHLIDIKMYIVIIMFAAVGIFVNTCA